MLIPHNISRKWFLPVSTGAGFVLPLGKQWRHGFVFMEFPCAKAAGYPR